MRFVGRQANRQSWPARKLIQGLRKPDAMKPKGFQQIRIFLTDLYGSFPPCAPSYPVLWATTGGRRAPFGEVSPLQAA